MNKDRKKIRGQTLAGADSDDGGVHGGEDG